MNTLSDIKPAVSKPRRAKPNVTLLLVGLNVRAGRLRARNAAFDAKVVRGIIDLIHECCLAIKHDGVPEASFTLTPREAALLVESLGEDEAKLVRAAGYKYGHDGLVVVVHADDTYRVEKDAAPTRAHF